MAETTVLTRSPIVRGIVGLSYLVLLAAFLPALGSWPSARYWIGGFTLVAAFLFLYEAGLSMELSPAGLRRRRGFPRPAETFIPWDAVETVSADLKTVVRLGPLGGPASTSDDSRLVVRGAGRSIVLHVPLFRGGPEDVSRVLELAAPAAVAWTLAEVRGKGEARLGRVVVAAGGLTVRGRLSGGDAVAYKDMTLVSFQHGALRIDAGGRAFRVPLAGLPNGPYLARVIAALSA